MSVANPSHRRTITISTVVSILSIVGVILPILGALGSPWLVGFLSAAVAGEVQQQVEYQVAPVSAAMKVLIESQIVALEDEIASLEYRRDRSPRDWTETEARELLVKQRRLLSQRQALLAMNQVGKVKR